MYGLFQRIAIYALPSVLIGVVLERIWGLLEPIMTGGDYTSPIVGWTEAVLTNWLLIAMLSLLVMLIVGANAESEVA